MGRRVSEEGAMRNSRTWLTAVLTGLLAVAMLHPTATAASTQESLFSLIVVDPAFSPNGDGRKDQFHLSFTLRKPAHVRLRWWGPDGPFYVRLGRLGIGRHLWTWDGLDPDGRVWPDGTYGLELAAHRGDRVSKDFENIDLRNHVSGRLETTRPVVYPLATTVTDSVELLYVASDWDPYNEDYWGLLQARARLRILDGSGAEVFRAVQTDTYTPRFTWTARGGSTGAALPEGLYLAQLRMVDWAGNVQRYETSLRVSHLDLVAKVWTEELVPDAVSTYNPYFDGCNGCGDVCAPVPSERFPHGLSFRHPCAESSWLYGSERYFTTDVPFPAAPVDTYRISMAGGPTVPGSGDHADLFVAEQTKTTAVGDVTVTSPWSPVDLDHQPNVPTMHQPVVWSVYTSLASYDVASFTVEYRHYVPVR
jgi:hypothetical protein